MIMVMKDKEARDPARVRDVMIKDMDIIRIDMTTQAKVTKIHLMTQPLTTITMTAMTHLILRGGITLSSTGLVRMDM